MTVDPIPAIEALGTLRARLPSFIWLPHTPATS
jgi:hypothetical protein